MSPPPIWSLMRLATSVGFRYGPAPIQVIWWAFFSTPEHRMKLNFMNETKSGILTLVTVCHRDFPSPASSRQRWEPSETHRGWCLSLLGSLHRCRCQRLWKGGKKPCENTFLTSLSAAEGRNDGHNHCGSPAVHHSNLGGRIIKMQNLGLKPPGRECLFYHMVWNNIS